MSLSNGYSTPDIISESNLVEYEGQNAEVVEQQTRSPQKAVLSNGGGGATPLFGTANY